MPDRNALPGGAISSRPLRFYWILDVSGSMRSAGKIQSLNGAVRSAIPAMQAVAAENPHVQLLVRTLAFSTGTRWMTGEPVPVDSVEWKDLKAKGRTDMGAAMRAMAVELSVEAMPARSCPPVLIMVTDGRPGDAYKTGLRTLLAEPWGRRAIRLAIAIGEEAKLDVLRNFIGHSEIEPLVAQNAADLVGYIRWASTAVVDTASAPRSQAAAEERQRQPSAMDGIAELPRPIVRHIDPTAVW
mgnify:CR=1 FL=1